MDTDEGFEFSDDLMGMLSQSQNNGRSPSPGKIDMDFDDSESLGLPSASPSLNDSAENLFAELDDDIPPEPVLEPREKKRILSQNSDLSLLTQENILTTSDGEPNFLNAKEGNALPKSPDLFFGEPLSQKKPKARSKKPKARSKKPILHQETPKVLPKNRKSKDMQREKSSENKEEKTLDEKSLRFNPVNSAKELEHEQEPFIDWKAYEARRLQTQKEVEAFENKMKEYNDKLDAIENDLLKSDRNTLNMMEREEDMRSQFEELALNLAHKRVDIALARVRQTSLNFQYAAFEMEVKEFFDAQDD